MKSKLLLVGALVAALFGSVSVGAASASTEASSPQGVAYAVPVKAGDPVALAGQFDWNVSFKYRVYSRVWYQNAGNTKIVAYFNCSGDPYIAGVYVQLSGRGENVFWRCDQWLEYTWLGVGSGNKQFVVTKADDGRYISGSGTTYYP
jgi:hypothetical protein